MAEQKKPVVASVADFLSVVHKHSYANKHYNWMTADKEIADHIAKCEKDLKPPDDWDAQNDLVWDTWGPISQTCIGFDAWKMKGFEDDDYTREMRDALEQLLRVLRPDCFPFDEPE